jgi:hypothetical protein
MVLLPVFVLVGLGCFLLLWMATARGQAVSARETSIKDIALREPNWPPRAQQFAYAFSNQFELPVLFYLLSVLSVITHHADLVYLVLAWIFVALRVLQAFVHVTNNNVPRRGAFYGIGALVLLAMWLVFIVRILAGLP